MKSVCRGAYGLSMNESMKVNLHIAMKMVNLILLDYT